MSDKIQAKVSRSREVNMFGELFHANRVLLENAREMRPGHAYEWMSCLIFSAFKCEAFINHLGYKLMENWDDCERSSHERKLDKLAFCLEVPIDNGKRPFQTLHQLFRFRNSLAHGKPEFLEVKDQLETGSREDIRRNYPRTEWESICTANFCEIAYEDTEQIAEMLWSAAGFDLKDLRIPTRSYSITVLNQ